MKYKGLSSFIVFINLFIINLYSAPIPIPNINISVAQANSPKQVSQALQIIILLTILTLVPSILVLMTSFTRIIIVLSFLRNALGTQQTPPNQVLIGFALLLTFMIMTPVFSDINKNAIKPYLKGKISYKKAYFMAEKPLRKFMLKQTRKKDLKLFINAAKLKNINSPNDVPFHIVVAAFTMSELKTAFEIGFGIFIPFLVIDMVISSILMSMGMIMLPPVMISLPFKILLFVLVDGWYLVVQSLIVSFK